MSEAGPPPSDLVTELQVSAHLMQLDAGVYCVYHSPDSTPPDPLTGLPGARLSLPPGATGQAVSIAGFRDDGWLGSLDAAALIRVSQGPAQVLMTIYQAAGATQPPRLQVTKLVDGVPATPVTAAPPPLNGQQADPPGEAEIAAHIQHRGDVVARLGGWVGDRGSQRWIEGFAISPRLADLASEDIEYQAVLGRGWLSPWSAGTQYCGSRGMALPILGLRVRLRGKAAQTHTVRVSGTFTDGVAVGPVGPGEACEAGSLAPLEAFLIEVVALRTKQPAMKAATSRAKASVPAKPAAKIPAKTVKPPPTPGPKGRRR